MEFIILSFNIQLVNQNQKMKNNGLFHYWFMNLIQKHMFCFFILPFNAEIKKGN